MKPGRELDALVAEKVMGLEKIGYPEGGFLWICGGFSGENAPAYSTNIQWAWQVVEKMGEYQHSLTLTVIRGNVTANWLGVQGGNSEARGVTAPHAICLAALKAVGYKIKEPVVGPDK